MIPPFNRPLGISTLLGIAFAALAYPASGAPTATAVEDSRALRATYNLNVDWKLFVGEAKGAEAVEFNDAAWKAVTLPHAWNEDEAFKKDIRDLSTGVA